MTLLRAPCTNFQMFVCSSIAQNNPPSLTFKSHAFSPSCCSAAVGDGFNGLNDKCCFPTCRHKEKMSVPLFFFDILNLMLTKNDASAITESAAF